jgi:hypothetical protein
MATKDTGLAQLGLMVSGRCAVLVVLLAFTVLHVFGLAAGHSLRWTLIVLLAGGQLAFWRWKRGV